MVIKSEKKITRIGICEVCGEEIFRIIVTDCDRVWFHEKHRLDYNHRARPKVIKETGDHD